MDLLNDIYGLWLSMDGLDWFTIPRYHQHEGRESWFGLRGTFTKSNISARSRNIVLSRNSGRDIPHLGI